MQQWQPPPSSHGHWPVPPPPDRSGFWAVALIGAAVVAVGVVLLGAFVVVGRSRAPAPAKPPSAPPLKVTVVRVRDDYHDNELAADKMYRGRLLQITALVDSVTRSSDGRGVVHLMPERMLPNGSLEPYGDGWIFDSHARLRESEESKAAKLRPGQHVTLQCVGAGRADDTTPGFDDCTIN